MDMLNKLKKKVLEDVEESESESSSSSKGLRSNGEAMSDDPVALQKEVTELKEHINKNYLIYVKRLEKRKERIKELEEYSKALLGDNERVNEKLKDYEDCQKQLKDYKENLEQLEGFQSQELAKVKHMLLSAETALEKETKTRKKLEKDLENTSKAQGNVSAESSEAVEVLKSENESLKQQLQELRESEKVRTDELTKSFEEKLARLEERLGQQDLGGDERLAAVTKERDEIDASLQKAKESLSDLKAQSDEATKKSNAEVERLQAEVESQKKKTATLTSERDQAKNALLEHEIAQHERQADLGAEKEKVNLELARLNTEKETLEVTLERRDKELKAKKEEFRDSLAKAEKSRDEAVKQLEAKTLRISALDAEKEVLKGKLVEESNSLLSAEARLERAQSKLNDSEKKSKALRDENAVLKTSLAESKQTAEEAKTKLEVAEDKFDALNTDYDKIVIQLDETMASRNDFQTRWKSAEEKAIAAEEEVRELKAIVAEKDSTFLQRVEESDTVQSLRKRVGEMEDELSDKRNIIKVHQQKMNDMKKTFQKEMRSSAERSVAVNGSHSPPPTNPGGAMAAAFATSRAQSPPKTRSSPSSSFDYDPTSVEDMVPMTDVNVRYLKHVIFKFFTSREYEAKNLTKAMAALLHFTRDEEKLFQEHLDWKMSWFGTKPKLGSGQFALSIDPS